MDVDKPLDELITDKRKSQGPRRGNGPRPSRERGASGPTPYVRPPPRSTEDTWVHDAYQGPGGPRRAVSGGANVANVAGTGAVFTGVSPRIEVVGLHYEVTPADLKTIFSQAGTLVQGPTIRISCASCQYDRSGRSKGEATMEFASYQQAKIAINKFDGAMTKGQTISIRLLPPITPKTGGGPRAQNGPPGASLLSRISGNNPPTARGGRGGGGGGGGRGGPRGRGAPADRGRRAPASAGDLDKELVKFMTPAATNAGDVDMS